MMPSPNILRFFAFIWLFPFTNAAIGDVICRYTSTTPTVVNYYICSQFAHYYRISNFRFFELNPTLNPQCNNIEPNTEYCVAGFIEEQLISADGFCGPQHGNATCIGTDQQCCNSQTWQCGDSTDDCAAGVCYEGDCEVESPTLYSLDGQCGPETGDKICTGIWGDCCGYDGLCGNGSDYCSQTNCQSGACEQPPMPEEEVSLIDIFGTTPDGTCGGSEGYICGVVYGTCCGKDNTCGQTLSECGAGCQPAFGTCDSASSTTQPAQPSGTSKASLDGSCGGASGYSCKNSPLGNCCSGAGFCGSTAEHCAGACQPGYGVCRSPIVSRDGTCGGSKGLKCLGSGYGDCCSSTGYCGSSTDHCEAGCQENFGKCTVGGASILVWDPVTGNYVEPIAPEPTSTASEDGMCGPGNRDLTCNGGAFDGQCCSAAGWCGSTTDHCNSGCQWGYGKCN